MDGHDSTSAITALTSAVGLTLSDEEARQLAAFHARFTPDRELLRQLDLGETEPAVIFTPTVETEQS